MALRVPSGSQRGTARHDSPASVWASIRNRSLMGAEQNHLWPTRAYSSPGPGAPVGVARGGVGPDVGPALLLGHGHAGQRPLLGGDRLGRGVVGAGGEGRLPHPRASSGWVRRAGTIE